MLEDREYMRRRPTGDDEGNARSGRTCILALIIINAAVYLLFGGNTSLCLDPVAVRNGDVLRIVTAVFMHEGFFHLLFNMYALYFFGMMIAPTLGARRFLSLFLFSGVAGNVLWLAANWNTPALLLGASGAVMGVIMAAALLAPDVEILILFIPFPLKLRTAALVFAGIDVFMFISGDQTGVAYLAHIGGFLAGYLFSRIFLHREIRWDPLGFLSRHGGASKNFHFQQEYPFRSSDGNRDPHGESPRRSGPVTQQELDYLLDKISRDGINSLSEEEMARLRQARTQMRDGQ